MKALYDPAGRVLAYTQHANEGLKQVFSPRGVLLGYLDASGTYLADAEMIATEPDIGLLIGLDDRE